MAAPPEPPVAEQLYAEPHGFDFFQAVRLLRELAGDAAGSVPADAAVRFAAHQSLSFPPSAVAGLNPAAAGHPPLMTVAFLGLTGAGGVLPRHYTELLLRVDRDVKGPEKHALRDWLDVFNHRAAALFYAAWEKYRFPLPFARGEADRADPDPFTLGLLSLIGLGTGGLRNRLAVRPAEPGPPADAPDPDAPARADDLGLLRFAGILAQRHRDAWGLEAVLGGYFDVPVRVEQFQGRWLLLDEPSQTRLGADDGNCTLGTDAVAGDRVWDVQGKFRVRLGPLRYGGFLSFLPDAAAGWTAFALLVKMTRLYAGPEFDFDVQLVLTAEHAPPCVLDDHAAGPRLGWNCWLLSAPLDREADDAVFEAGDG
ncbi:type VI secretion system baseplate subunit TssG [bacterium]|nr:type VI secretion system baseplate subunit TssG [bacterium]